MKYLKPILAVTGIGVIGYALYRYYLNQLNFLKDIQYKITGVRIVNVQQGDVTLEIIMDVYNASNVDASINEIYLDVTMNGVKVGSINESKEFAIKGTSSSQVRYNLTFNPSLILKNAINIAAITLSLKDINFVADGYIKVKSGFISTTLPFTYQNTLKNLLK